MSTTHRPHYLRRPLLHFPPGHLPVPQFLFRLSSFWSALTATSASMAVLSSQSARFIRRNKTTSNTIGAIFVRLVVKIYIAINHKRSTLAALLITWSKQLSSWSHALFIWSAFLFSPPLSCDKRSASDKYVVARSPAPAPPMLVCLIPACNHARRVDCTSFPAGFSGHLLIASFSSTHRVYACLFCVMHTAFANFRSGLFLESGEMYTFPKVFLYQGLIAFDHCGGLALQPELLDSKTYHFWTPHSLINIVKSPLWMQTGCILYLSPLCVVLLLSSLSLV